MYILILCFSQMCNNLFICETFILLYNHLDGYSEVLVFFFASILK
ncbi:MAG: hypothetical protein TRG1_2875 [Flavobacteriaceae bacterium FS1-H7996/R]|nr:MAG: hypothetical protein TRG1_2875 [Flavobacteriaceae bacterium FS1-H7996/R]